MNRASSIATLQKLQGKTRKKSKNKKSKKSQTNSSTLKTFAALQRGGKRAGFGNRSQAKLNFQNGFTKPQTPSGISPSIWARRSLSKNPADFTKLGGQGGTDEPQKNKPIDLQTMMMMKMMQTQKQGGGGQPGMGMNQAVSPLQAEQMNREREKEARQERLDAEERQRRIRQEDEDRERAKRTEEREARQSIADRALTFNTRSREAAREQALETNTPVTPKFMNPDTGEFYDGEPIDPSAILNATVANNQRSLAQQFVDRIDSFSRAMADNETSIINELTSSLAETRRRLAERGLDRENTQAMLSATNQELEKVREELKQSQTEQMRSETRMAGTQNIDEALNNVRELSREVSELQEKLQRAEAEKSAKDASLTEALSSYAEAETGRVTSESRHQTASTELTLARQERDTFISRNTELMARLNEASLEKSRLESELAMASTDSESKKNLQNSLAELNERIKSLSNERQQLDMQRREQQGQITALEEGLASAGNTGELRGQLARAESEKQRAESELEGQKSETKRLRGDIDKSLTRLKDFQAGMANIARNVGLSRGNGVEGPVSPEEVSKISDFIANSRQKLENLQTEHSKLEAKHSELSGRAEELEAAKESAHAKIRNLSHQLEIGSGSQAERASMEAQIAAYENVIRDSSEQMRKLQNTKLEAERKSSLSSSKAKKMAEISSEYSEQMQKLANVVNNWKMNQNDSGIRTIVDYASTEGVENLLDYFKKQASIGREHMREMSDELENVAFNHARELAEQRVAATSAITSAETQAQLANRTAEQAIAPQLQAAEMARDQAEIDAQARIELEQNRMQRTYEKKAEESLRDTQKALGQLMTKHFKGGGEALFPDASLLNEIVQYPEHLPSVITSYGDFFHDKLRELSSFGEPHISSGQFTLRHGVIEPKEFETDRGLSQEDISWIINEGARGKLAALAPTLTDVRDRIDPDSTNYAPIRAFIGRAALSDPRNPSSPRGDAEQLRPYILDSRDNLEDSNIVAGVTAIANRMNLQSK